MPKLTKEEIAALTQAIFHYRCYHFGCSKLTDYGMFGDIAFDHEEQVRQVEKARDKLLAEGLVNW